MLKIFIVYLTLRLMGCPVSFDCLFADLGTPDAGHPRGTVEASGGLFDPSVTSTSKPLSLELECTRLPPLTSESTRHPTSCVPSSV